MYKKRTYIAVLAIASAGLLAACSQEDDATTMDPVAPPATLPESSGTAPITPAPQPAPPPMAAPESGALDQTPDTVQNDERTVGEKAAELRDDAIDAADRAGDAIKDGAARADKAIQDRLGNGNTNTQPNEPDSLNP